ncbi:MAG: cysteine desulfurase-like protein [Deltaproteobacteria bacterium]|nr:MAG: cysteine desulfurase-like protein [Deltaproteobacteria bacterium]
MTYDVKEVRAHFPALESGDVFFDGPGGTQVPREAIEAVNQYYTYANANFHGAFITSRRTDKTTLEARYAVADFLNAHSEKEIVFGPNMTTLTFNLSRAIGRILSPGDEIIVSRLDHDANIAPWLALQETGAVIRWIDFHHEDCTLDMASFEKCLGPKTKIVAVGYASNLFGTVNAVSRIIEAAHQAGATTFIDAVHYAPHAPIDVQAIDCDFLACSAYKFFGPHVGVLYGKYDHLDRLQVYKVRPSGEMPPDKFETGTQNFEGQAGTTATLNLLAWIGEKYAADFSEQFKPFEGRRLNLKTAMAAIEFYEMDLFSLLMEGFREVSGMKIFGVTDPTRFKDRVPTVAFRVNGHTPREIAERMAAENIYVWDGHCYALEPVKRLGLEKKGGVVRVGLSLYNTKEEVNRLISALKRITG